MSDTDPENVPEIFINISRVNPHAGHEKMHLEMLFNLIAAMCLTQVLVVVWRKKHEASYQLTSLLFLWLIPFLYSVWFRYTLMIMVWSIFSIINLWIVFKATRVPILPTTPRLVYGWFYQMHRLTCFVSITGYIVLVLTFLGPLAMVGENPSVCLGIGLLGMFYGAYYGLLCRDFAEFCTRRLASKIGYYSPCGLPIRKLARNICAICSNELTLLLDQDTSYQQTYSNVCSLSCGHSYHEFCIRGWCIVGKKQTCPYCNEKVDLKKMFPSPWEQPHLLFGRCLDFLRFLVAWQPLVYVMAETANYYLGLH